MRFTSDTVRVRLPGGTLVVRARGTHYELAGPRSTSSKERQRILQP